MKNVVTEVCLYLQPLKAISLAPSHLDLPCCADKQPFCYHHQSDLSSSIEMATVAVHKHQRQTNKSFHISGVIDVLCRLRARTMLVRLKFIVSVSQYFTL